MKLQCTFVSASDLAQYIILYDNYSRICTYGSQGRISISDLSVTVIIINYMFSDMHLYIL